MYRDFTSEKKKRKFVTFLYAAAGARYDAFMQTRPERQVHPSYKRAIALPSSEIPTLTSVNLVLEKILKAMVSSRLAKARMLGSHPKVNPLPQNAQGIFFLSNYRWHRDYEHTSLRGRLESQRGSSCDRSTAAESAEDTQMVPIAATAFSVTKMLSSSLAFGRTTKATSCCKTYAFEKARRRKKKKNAASCKAVKARHQAAMHLNRNIT